MESEYATKQNQPSQGLRAYSLTAPTGLVFLWSSEMDRDKVIDEYLEEYENELLDMDDNKMFGEDTIEDMRQKLIQDLVEDYELELDAQNNDELFGEEQMEELREHERGRQIEAMQQRLESMDDGEFAKMILEGKELIVNDVLEQLLADGLVEQSPDGTMIRLTKTINNVQNLQ